MVIAATMANVAITSLLFTMFGYAAGALTSLAWMMLQVFSYGGVWMVETLPAPFKWLHPISPMTYYRDGLIAAFNGASGFTTAFVTTLGIAIVAAFANVAVYRVGAARERREEPAEATVTIPEPAVAQ
jgi:putative membrane protein